MGAGLANSVELEIAARAVQGVGAAFIAPSALTLLMMLFGNEPKELTKALALYGAAAPAGGTAGVFLGGVITEWISWPWVFYVNIPIALLVLAVTPGLMPSAAARRGTVDITGAIADGFSAAFIGAAGIAVAGALLAAVTLRKPRAGNTANDRGQGARGCLTQTR